MFKFLLAGIAGIFLAAGLLTTAGAANEGRVRVIHASPDAPNVDVYANGNISIVGNNAPPFAVHANDRLYYGNCIWDALGIPAMLRVDARIDGSCGCCGESMRLALTAGELGAVDGVVHFALPARRWWDDIVYN